MLKSWKRTAQVHSPLIGPPLHRMEEKTCAPRREAVRKRRILFAGFVALMGNGRRPKRVLFGEVDGGYCYSGGQ